MVSPTPPPSPTRTFANLSTQATTGSPPSSRATLLNSRRESNLPPLPINAQISSKENGTVFDSSHMVGKQISAGPSTKDRRAPVRLDQMPNNVVSRALGENQVSFVPTPLRVSADAVTASNSSPGQMSRRIQLAPIPVQDGTVSGVINDKHSWVQTTSSLPVSQATNSFQTVNPPPNTERQILKAKPLLPLGHLDSLPSSESKAKVVSNVVKSETSSVTTPQVFKNILTVDWSTPEIQVKPKPLKRQIAAVRLEPVAVRKFGSVVALEKRLETVSTFEEMPAKFRKIVSQYLLMTDFQALVPDLHRSLVELNNIRNIIHIFPEHGYPLLATWLASRILVGPKGYGREFYYQKVILEAIKDRELAFLKTNPEIIKSMGLQNEVRKNFSLRIIRQLLNSGTEFAYTNVAKLIGMHESRLDQTGETCELSNSATAWEELNEMLADQNVLDKVAEKADSIASLGLTNSFDSSLLGRALALNLDKGLALLCRSLSNGAIDYGRCYFPGEFAPLIAERFMRDFRNNKYPLIAMVLNSPLWAPVHKYLQSHHAEERSASGIDPAMEWFIAGINLATKVQKDRLKDLEKAGFTWARNLRADGYSLVKGFKMTNYNLLSEFYKVGYEFATNSVDYNVIKREGKVRCRLVKDFAGYSLIKDLKTAGYSLDDLTPAVRSKITCLALDKDACNLHFNIGDFILTFDNVEVLRLENPYMIRFPTNESSRKPSWQKLRGLTLCAKKMRNLQLSLPKLEYLSLEDCQIRLANRYEGLKTFVLKNCILLNGLPETPVLEVFDSQDTSTPLPKNSGLKRVVTKKNSLITEARVGPKAEVFVLKDCPNLVELYPPEGKNDGTMPITLRHLHVTNVGNPDITAYCNWWNSSWMISDEMIHTLPTALPSTPSSSSTAPHGQVS